MEGPGLRAEGGINSMTLRGWIQGYIGNNKYTVVPV